MVYIKELKLTNFRNYDHLNISFVPGMNIIVGLNAQGKTNLLESIYLINLTKSHRTNIDKNLIKENKSKSTISANLYNNDYINKYEIIIGEEQKQISINKTPIRKISEYLQNTGVIIFFPEDLDLIKGGPQERRKFLNTELSQLNSTYVTILNDYNKLLKMRNNLLKKEAKHEKIDEVYFETLTEHLITRAIHIYKYRNKFIEKINLNIENIYSTISGYDNFKINYINNIAVDIYEEDKIREKLIQLLKTHHQLEIKLGSTIYGPHKDDFEFLLNSNNLYVYGSQGQQRMAVLALKLSEINIFKETKNLTPIVLLDDIFSELDVKKRNNIMKFLNNNTQTIMTTTDIKNIRRNILKNAKIFVIDSGTVREEKIYG